jgi:23S rRNA (uridine2552-2'-O)-methyltransferase
VAHTNYNPQDHFFKKAKAEGFAARSAYKLQEIQKRHRVLRQGDKVLDLGCAPGSWSQVASQIVGGKGFVEGLDLKPIDKLVADKIRNGRFQVLDVFNMTAEHLSNPQFDVVLSDMAPNTSGIPFQDQARSEELCMKVLELCRTFLKPGGHVVMKLFMGPDAKQVENATRALFKSVKQVRPDSTRKQSKEIFVVGLGRAPL